MLSCKIFKDWFIFFKRVLFTEGLSLIVSNTLITYMIAAKGIYKQKDYCFLKCSNAISANIEIFAKGVSSGANATDKVCPKIELAFSHNVPCFVFKYS